MAYDAFARRFNAVAERIRWPFRLKLTDDIRVWWRLWSIRLGILGTTLAGAAVAFPDMALQAWAGLPYEVRQLIPEQFMPMIGIALFVLSMLARFVKQRKAGEVLAQKKAEEIEKEKGAIADELNRSRTHDDGASY